ncbi:MAG: phage DNA encapsidation protein, partial [Bacilli bacterium]|nr:phage DNA encapsidation protein [Bacilli bacterium]
MNNKNIHYSFNRVLSYSEAMLYFIIGERGVGKTYGATKYVANRFLKKNKQFVYLRRYKTELKTSVPKFWDAIKSNNEFPGQKLEVKGNNFYINNKICGYAIPLSTANILKSTTFDNVDTIIFDEFILDKGNYHYLQNEVEKLLDIIETIGRLRDIKILFLGNAISVTNPYFLYFDLRLPYKSDIAKFKNGLIIVNYIKNENYRNLKKQTKFGRLIEGTDYGRYAIDNEFLRDNTSFIEKKDKKAKFIFIIYLNHKKYGIWLNNENMFISEQIDPNCPIIITFNTNDHSN